jgi:hypothetical protein
MATELMADRVEAELDTLEFTCLAMANGWGDGLPCVAPTEQLVREFISASGLPGDHVIGKLPPLRADCTVELVAINAVMAGAPAESMPLICAVISAINEPAYDLAGVNATTASVTQSVVVNGPVRDRIGIPYRYSAVGGFAGPAPAIGRAIRLVIRNVAGQVSGQTSESVFGQPGRVVGIVVGEWEEESPWPPLSERRGVAGDAVSVFGVLGTANVLDSVAESGQEVLQVMGRSLGFMGNNNFCQASQFAEQLIAVNPVWANKVIARDVPSFEDVLQIVWEAASIRIDEFPETLRPGIEARGRVRADGRVYLMDSPDDLNIFVCGGLGSLHGCMFPGMSNHLSVTKAIG